MNESLEKKNCCMALLAHVDAGKTTLSEALLKEAAVIRTLGRVDHQNTFLDYDLQERQRGITILSKQALFDWHTTHFTLIDTPGHVDFSAEMERTLQILDYAVLLISAQDGIQPHTRTIWKLLESYQIPVFLFINKMDQTYRSQAELLEELRNNLSENCLDIETILQREENVALCSPALLEMYLTEGRIPDPALAKAIAQRQLFPCFFGSALKQEGIRELLDGLDQFTLAPSYPAQFGAHVFKISRDPQGNRLTHVKITGGTLRAKSLLQEEKVDQIRIYSGNKFILVQEAKAGTVCCLKGPQKLQIHDSLGIDARHFPPQLAPCLDYRMILPPNKDRFQVFRQLKQLEEENPELHLQYLPSFSDIRVAVMGKIQIEILQQMILDRFQLSVTFDQGKISYKETILEPVEGVGHYEPLRHYAEVHLLLTPLERGSGLIIDSDCPEEMLEAKWQRIILDCLDQNELTGVLINAPLTDMRITLLGGKAHLKHTQSSDFREAALRALRHGLTFTRSLLLEPIYHFELVLPSEFLSRALHDLERMHAETTLQTLEKGKSRIVGTAAVRMMQNYQSEVLAYTRGQGQLSWFFSGFQPCSDQEAVVAESGYDPQRDPEHSADSIFCAHGAGFLVKAQDVYEHMHLERLWQKEKKVQESPIRQSKVSEEELNAVMERTYKRKERPAPRPIAIKKELPEHIEVKPVEKKTACLLVDGYNMIYSWENLSLLAQTDLFAAREELIRILSDYLGRTDGILIVVFDAWKVPNNPGKIIQQGNFYQVYTKTSETADSYIEKTTHHLAKEYQVTVATSDGMEQRIILGQGALRLSARELKKRIESARKQSGPLQPSKPHPLAELKKQMEK